MMDDLLKEFIINNKLTLTLLAIVFAPVGLYTGWRFLHGSEGASRGSPGDVERRLEAIEVGLEALMADVADMNQQQARLAAALERAEVPSVRPGDAPRAVPPVEERFRGN